MNAAGSLMEAVQRYLQERRQLGFALIAAATELKRFARFADSRGHEGPITLELQIAWAQEHVRRTSEVTAARRLEITRPFVAYYRQFEVASEIPPTGVLGRGHRRLTPHIYTDKEIHALLDAASGLTPTGGMRPLTYCTLFGLIVAAGLRLSEALQLKVCDVDLDKASITVRQTKFHKSRCLPIAASAVQALVHYRDRRSQHADPGAAAPFFASRSGGILPKRTVENVFARLRPSLQWQTRGDHKHPRIHDLRHTFAVRRVQRWHEAGVSIEHAMFWLCTYLGHAKISDTYWYLTGVPELMELVGSKFERFACEGGSDE
jgi:site-specific recombinase XerD